MSPLSIALNDFEHDLYEMVRNIKFRPVRNAFQNQLSQDLKSIRSSQKILVAADKTTNIYKMEVEDYKKMPADNITSSCQKADSKNLDEINCEARILTSKLDLADRVQCYARKPAFITLKDHKPNFDNNPKCRLINPAKSEVERISKILLDKINNEVRCKTNLNQWRSTKSVVDWFQNLDAQRNTKFIKFDIVNFYPSISENLLEDAIAFANKFAKISNNTRQMIAHARKSLLFEQGSVWSKIDKPNFAVAMGSYDGAEVCELVGLYLLDELAELLEK